MLLGYQGRAAGVGGAHRSTPFDRPSDHGHNDAVDYLMRSGGLHALFIQIEDEGTPMQFQHVAIQIEPDAPPMPEVAGIWVNSVLIILLVPAVIFGLDFFVQNV